MKDNNGFTEPMWNGKVFHLSKGHDLIPVSNFVPRVKSILNITNENIIVFAFETEFGYIEGINIPFKKLKRTDWTEYCLQCTLFEEHDEAKKLMYEYVKKQITQCAGKAIQVGQVQRVGWHKSDDGTYRYECGNCCIGQSENVVDKSVVASYRLDYNQDKIAQKATIETYMNLLQQAPEEAVILLDYFFTGLIRPVYQQAEIPVDFVVYVSGVQQSRKTTLAKLSNNLYCRNDNMDFAVRSLPEMTKTDVDNVLAQFSDTTLILDDVALTASGNKRRQQEELLEYVIRLVGNHTRQSKCNGNGVKEFDPNVNVVFTGEYIPKMAESALTRMIIIDLNKPVSKKWIGLFRLKPDLLSTVAYCFLQWVQAKFQECVEITKKNLQVYREDRSRHEEYQERIQEHAFILSNTNFLVSCFLFERTGELEVLMKGQARECKILKDTLRHQVELIETHKIRVEETNFCDKFALLYLEDKIQIEKDMENYNDKLDDGFMKDNRYICIKSEKLLAIMRNEYQDSNITIQKITKQFRMNRFLVTESGRTEKSTKKIDGRRYLCIDKKILKDYVRYNMGLRN